MKNLPCQKRRRIVIRSKDGSKKEEYRCANSIAQNYKNTIDKSICQNCTLRQPFLKPASTSKKHPPIDSTWPEPYYEENGDIIYPFQDGVQQPPIPQGYKRKSDKGTESWWFITDWGQCSYRQMMNERTSQGNLQINTYCTARKNCTVKYEECKQCLFDIAEIGGNLNEKIVKNSIPLPEPIKERLGEDGIPDFPGANELLDNYWKAVKKWIIAGRPKRKASEVKRIHKEFCLASPTPCDWYDSKSQRCKGCGCKVKPKGIAILNKIRMETEHCPKGLW